MSELIGKYLVHDDVGHEAFRTGKVIAQLSPSEYLVSYDLPLSAEPTLPIPGMEVIGIAEMLVRCDDCGSKYWKFFATKDGFDKFIAWIHDPHDEDGEGCLGSATAGTFDLSSFDGMWIETDRTCLCTCEMSVRFALDRGPARRFSACRCAAAGRKNQQGEDARPSPKRRYLCNGCNNHCHSQVEF